MKKLFTMISLLLLSSCSSRIADFSVVVPQNTTITQQNLTYTQVNKNITGVDQRGMFFIFPLGFPTFENAVKDTLQKGNGEILTNVHVTSSTDWYVLYGLNRIEVKADVVKLSGGYRHE